MIARQYENIARAFPDKTDADLRTELQVMEDRLGILRRLKVLKQFEDEELLQTHNVLNIFRSDTGELSLEVIPFNAPAPAIEKASELENDSSSLNAVYVRADNPKQLRSAYRNYFNDPIDFVEIIQSEGELD